MGLNLYLCILPNEIENWYCYEIFDEFFNAIADEMYDPENLDGNSSTREEEVEFLKNSLDIQLHEIVKSSSLNMIIDKDTRETRPILVSDFIKQCNKGYVGENLFEIYKELE